MKYADIENGIMLYINKEFCKKLTDWRKWAIPVMAGVYSPTLKKMYNDNIEMLKSANIVTICDTGEHNIHIEELFSKLSQVSRDTGNIVCNIPLIGNVTFSTDDVTCLYNILKGLETNNTAISNTNTVVI